MRQSRPTWQPDAAIGIPVYGCAAILFPLHLGWAGTSWPDFAIYLAIATLLFAAVDALARPRINKLAIPSQSLLFVLAIGVPAALFFAVGSLLGPIDEAYEEQLCLTSGERESDSAEAESDDTFDFTPDCRPEN